MALRTHSPRKPPDRRTLAPRRKRNNHRHPHRPRVKTHQKQSNENETRIRIHLGRKKHETARESRSHTRLRTTNNRTYRTEPTHRNPTYPQPHQRTRTTLHTHPKQQQTKPHTPHGATGTPLDGLASSRRNTHYPTAYKVR
jgi:hypothetical protein